MSNRGRSKAPVASEVGCLIGPQREVLCGRTRLSVCLCTSGLIYMFASGVIFTAMFEFDLLVRKSLQQSNAKWFNSKDENLGMRNKKA